MPRKRAHGEGSVSYRKDRDRWIAQFSLPTGKRKVHYARSQREARLWLEEQKRLAHAGMIVVNDQVTVGEFLKRWFDEVARHTLRPTTLNSHASIMRRHIYPALTDIKLSQLSPAHLQALYSKKIDDGLSRKTVKYIHWIIHQALAQALKWGLVARNVSEAVEVVSAKRRRVEPLSMDQVSQLLKVLKGDRLYPFYVLLLSTGLRKGEALALKLDSLNLQEGIVRVDKTLNFLPGKGLVLGETKSERSRRVVALPEFTIQVLTEHLANRDVKSDFVFCTSNGTPFGPRNMIRHFKAVLARAGLPVTIRIHDLRHTFVSFMLAANVPASDVQKIAGHASFSTTVDIYGHLMAGAQKEAARKMNRLLTSK
ncbi:MAG: site-specific integrase [Anaerolineales bacterium]|nr:site-specific integrase [Anaerolineales bacterium]